MLLPGEVTNIVVAHKDRLARFGFDFLEWLCNLNGCKIVVLNNSYKPPHGCDGRFYSQVGIVARSQDLRIAKERKKDLLQKLTFTLVISDTRFKLNRQGGDINATEKEGIQHRN